MYDGLDAILEKDAGGVPVARYLRGLAIDEPWQRAELFIQRETGQTNGLRGWWKMNEGTGTTVADSSGNANNGTLPNGGSWTTGMASNAVVLDGVNDYVSIGDKATLEGNATWTFAGWINPSSFPAGRDTYLYYKDKVLLWGFLSGTNRRFSVNIGNGSGGNPWQGASTSAMDMNSNVWTHVAVTYTNSQVRFYVNGLLTETVSKTYTMGNNNQAFSISTATQAYPGKLDDVRYYNRALNDAEMVQVYGEQATNRCYLADALGSIVALAGTNKAVQTEYDYEPFGKSTIAGQATGNPYTFTGREDDGTGLDYYRARYYHPALGRFISEDPMGLDTGDVNYYQYASSNPLYWVDPTGLATRTPNPNGSSTIDVFGCEIVILHPHGDYKRPHTFRFHNRCNAGGFIGCGAGSTNAGIRKDKLIPGSPDWEDDVLTSEDRYKEAWKTMVAEARKLALSLCQKDCCREMKIIYIYQPQGDALKDSLQGTGTSTETIPCPKK